MIFDTLDNPIDPTTGQPTESAELFWKSLAQIDKQRYDALTWNAIQFNKANIMNAWRDEFLEATGIPAERLEEVQNYIRYGSGSVDSDDVQRLMQHVTNPEEQAWFNRQPDNIKSWLLNNMPPEAAERYIRSQMKEQQFEAQEKEREAAQAKIAETRQAREVAQIREENIGKFEQAFVAAKAVELNIPPAQVTEFLEVVTSRIDREISSLSDQLADRYPNATKEQLQFEAAKVNPLARSWFELSKASASRNQLRIDTAMNALRSQVEARFNEFLTGKGLVPSKAPTAPATPRTGAQGGNREPQFPVELPPVDPKATGYNASFVDSLFGKGDPQTAFR